MNILFICSMNQWRSPTAEQTYRNVNGIDVRSAGTSRKARRTVSHSDIKWADLICVMESKHRNKLKSDFRDMMNEKKLHVLDIEDNYKYMDSELVELLKFSVDPILESYKKIGKRFRTNIAIEIEIEGEKKPALTCNWINMHYFA